MASHAHQFDLLETPRPEFTEHADWLSWLHEQLPRPSPAADAPVALDLFAGCGGLSLGFEAAGFRTIGYEMKSAAVATSNANLHGKCYEQMLEVGDPPADQPIDVLIGGPPCQPFSQIGYQRGNRDPRDGFPIFLDAVQRFRPKIAIIENVRGLLFRNKDYLRLVVRELERFGYVAEARLLDASHYGVPQKRERLVIVAHQGSWEWPEPTVSRAVTAGVALGPLMAETRPDSKFLTPSMDRYIAKYEAASKCINPRDLHPNKPSRTVTCRNLGGGTGDMLRIALPNGGRRMLHTREGARLMSFPDWFEFTGTTYEQAEQIGNAVAPLVALALGRQAMAALETKSVTKSPSQPNLSLATVNPIEIKKEQALTILREVGLPVRDLTARARERAALCLLALAQIAPSDEWADAKSHVEDKQVKAQRSREVLNFRNEHYHEGISSGSYDDVRRKDLALLGEWGFVQARANKEDADTNDGTRGYALTLEGLALLRSFGTRQWEGELAHYRAKLGEIRDRLSKARTFNMMTVTLPNGEPVQLAGGEHNAIQKAIVEEFLPRYAHGAVVLYLGDALKKDLFVDEEGLRAVGLERPARGSRLPDIVAYEAERNWLFLIEAVHSSNPISEQRHTLLKSITAGATAGRVYVTAFATRKAFAKWLGSEGIAWETEVWCADAPEHLVHFNGPRFLGPYEEPASD